MNEEDLRQLCRITRYILLNYRDKITLNDIAEMEHLSSYYLSHLIKENLGFNFQSFLNAIRLEFAEKELVFTGKTLLQISQDCGFSSPNYFNKCFSAWYGKTPAQYRREYVSCERSYNSQFTQEEAFELLSVYLSDTGKSRNEKTDFLTPVTDFTSGGFSTLKGPAVLLDSISSIITLDQNREKISAIHPSAIMIDSDLLERNSDLGADMLPDDLTVRTGPVTSDDLITSVHPAEIFSNIFTGRQSCISLHSSVRSPFTSGCIDSAAYKSYSFLFAYGVPQVKAFDTYALIKCDGQCAAVFYNTGHVDMYIHINQDSCLSFLSANGLFRKRRNISICGAAINLVVSALLIKPLGIAGILAGTAISQVFYWAARSVVALRDCLKQSFRAWAAYWFRQLGLLGIIAAAIFLSSTLIRNLFVLNSVLTFVIDGIICEACFILLALVFCHGMEPERRLEKIAGSMLCRLIKKGRA